MKTEINPAYCKGCNICVYVCPKSVYTKSKKLSEQGYFVPNVSSPENCFNHERTGKMLCELCVLSCPEQAIKWVPEESGRDRLSV